MSHVDESWIEAFRFTEEMTDLEALEQSFHQDHQIALKSTVTEQAPNADGAFLETLSTQIADRLGSQMTQADLAQNTTRLQELERDNATMASQIQVLLRKLEIVSDQNHILRSELDTFHHWFGPFFQKVV